MTLQASLALINVNAPRSRASADPTENSLSDSVFAHPALDGLEALDADSNLDLVDKRRLAPLAGQYGLADVVRWLPKRVREPLRIAGIATS